ncbi:MAG: hypothetical protein A3B82_00870 [Methylophilales bacterium RIFCSPHIGHO2_02_FULL_57_10]|nr:MAG: hypothetical protein A3B82_00870 [Methylophilales bacterium RIFCSPHIGHO2_02_FULL_57_10]
MGSDDGVAGTAALVVAADPDVSIDGAGSAAGAGDGAGGGDVSVAATGPEVGVDDAGSVVDAGDGVDVSVTLAATGKGSQSLRKGE